MFPTSEVKGARPGAGAPSPVLAHALLLVAKLALTQTLTSPTMGGSCRSSAAERLDADVGLADIHSLDFAFLSGTTDAAGSRYLPAGRRCTKEDPFWYKHEFDQCEHERVKLQACQTGLKRAAAAHQRPTPTRAGGADGRAND